MTILLKNTAVNDYSVEKYSLLILLILYQICIVYVHVYVCISYVYFYIRK